MVRLGRAVVRGIDDATTSGGARLVLASFAVAAAANLLLNTVLDGLVVEIAALDTTVTTAYPVALSVPPGVATWLLVGAWIVGSWLLVVACRTFAGETGRLERADLTRDALPATIRTAAITGVGGALTLAGFVFGIVPGVLLFAHLVFAPVFVAVDGDGLAGAVARSWQLAAENRVRALAAAAGLTAVAAAGGAVGALLGVGSPALEFLLGALAVALFAVVTVGIAVDFRRQHERSGPSPSGAARGTGAGAL